MSLRLINCKITARLRRFSSCAGKDSVSTEYDCESCRGFNCIRKFFIITFYASGNCPRNEGHVSIIFNMQDFYRRTRYTEMSATFSCMASVIDAACNERFTQSFVADFQTFSEEDIFTRPGGFGIERYLRRSTLLNDPDELLPGDCLTLRLEISLFTTYPEPAMTLKDNFRSFKSNFARFDRENSRVYLRMDTKFAEDLCKMSSVFRDMIEFAKGVDGERDGIPISNAELGSFISINSLLNNEKIYLTLYSISQLYILSDKYDMQKIIPLCHQLLIASIRSIYTVEILEDVDGGMRHIKELAERFKVDEKLRKILKIYSDIKNKLRKGGTGVLYGPPIASDLENEWMCRHDIEEIFEFSKIEIESSEKTDIWMDMDIFK